MPTIPTTPTKSGPKLLDTPFDEITQAMKLNINWIDNCYGKIEKYKKTMDGRTKRFPGIYVGTKNNMGYLDLFPDSRLGNFMYIEVTRQDIQDDIFQKGKYDIDFSMIFWFNYKTVYKTDHNAKTIENVKSEVKNFIKTYSFQSITSLTMLSFEEGADNIYAGLDHDEIENQFLMRPFGGFRLNLNMQYLERCESDPPINIRMI